MMNYPLRIAGDVEMPILMFFMFHIMKMSVRQLQLVLAVLSVSVHVTKAEGIRFS